MLQKFKAPENILLIIILIVGAFLRFYNLTGFSLSNDELSALARTNYDSLADLINIGVKTNDMHPAGIQIFIYYLTKVFGYSEIAVRFPFALMGIAAILFSYLLASRWFNKTTGLFVAASFSFLEYTILYSQIARPYIPGVLLTLISIWFWTKLLFDNDRKKTNLIGYSLSTSLVTYTHHYAFLFALIVGITGFFFLKKENFKYYLGSVLIIAVLYIPHIPVFIYQFGEGGVGGWLGMPDEKWFWQYMSYVFNNSYLALYTVIGIFILTSIIGFRTRLSKFQIIAVIWFLLPYFIGYYYSIYRNPILQFSTLIFSFPFLLFFAFSFVENKLNLLNKVLIGILSLVLIYSTVFEKDYYHQQNFTEFRKIAADVVSWNEQYGAKNITQTININQPYYINYYLDKQGKPMEFMQYNCSDDNELFEMKKIVDKANTPYFIHGWSSVSNPYEIEDFIRSKYSIIEKRDTFLNSGIFLFKKGSPTSYFKNLNDFEKVQWQNDTLGRSKELSRSGKFSFKFTHEIEYGPTFRIPLTQAAPDQTRRINATVWVHTPDTTVNAHLIIGIKQGPYSRSHSSQIKFFNSSKEKWNRLFVTFPIPKGSNESEEVVVFIHNAAHQSFYIDDFEINVVDY